MITYKKNTQEQIPTYSIVKLFFTGLFLFLSIAISSAQTLPAFTLTVTPTNETCPASGALTMSTSGTRPGASIVYAIYKSPNYVTAIATTSLGSYTGLYTGDYRVVATQTLGTNYSQQTWNGTISGATPLTYQISFTNEHCGSDGTVTVTTTGGTPASTNAYSLYAADGTTLVKGPQTSNVFTNLAAGTYLVKVTDACAQVVTQNTTLLNYPPNVNFLGGEIGRQDLCNTFVYNMRLSSGLGKSLVYPLTLTATTHDPSGNVVDVQTKTQANYLGATVLENEISTAPLFNFAKVPITQNKNFVIDYLLTDGCGKTYTSSKTYNYGQVRPDVRSDCSGAYIYTWNTIFWAWAPFTYNITAAPAGFSKPWSGPLVGSDKAAATFGGPGDPIPNGTYVFTLTDACGNVNDYTFVVNYTPVTSVGSQASGPGCGVGTVNLELFPQNVHQFTAARVLLGPAAFLTTSAAAGLGSSYPVTATTTGSVSADAANLFAVANVYSTGQFAMSGVPPGTYVIETTDVCGNSYNTTVVATTIKNNGTVNITAPVLSCSSFKVNLNITGSNTSSDTYYLDFYNTTTHNWDRKMTLSNGVSNTPPSIAMGDYRVVKSYKTGGFSTSNGGILFHTVGRDCNEEVLKTFSYTGNHLAVDQLYGFRCPDGIHYDVYFSGKNGAEPYTYRITAKAGDPSFTPIDNGTQNLFTNLTGATYTFEISDACGNVVSTIMDVTKLLLPKITAVNVCPGAAGGLSVNGVSYLNFSWTKGSDPSVLSTTSFLPFPSFNPLTDIGTYHVHITSLLAGSCIDETLSYIVTGNVNDPHAGNDINTSVCRTRTSVDLNTLLDPTADPYGTWTETTAVPSGYLEGSVWSPSASAAGTYTFAYTVNGLCSGTDISKYTIVNTELPRASISYSNSSICANAGTQAPTLTGTNAYTGGTYSSTAGLSINATTGLIDPSVSTAGAYTVTYTIAAAGGCSEVTTTTNVIIKPAIAQVGVARTSCNSGNLDYTVAVEVLGNAPFMVTGTGAPGSWSGNTWTSNAITAGTAYNANITDVNNCNTLNVNGVSPVCCLFEVACPTFPVTTVECYGELPNQTSYTEAEFEALGNADGLIGDIPCGVIEITASNSADAGTCSQSVIRTYTVTEYVDPNNNDIRDLGEDTVLNTQSCAQTITVQDTTAPTFVETLPTNVTVECNAVPTAETLTATDNCGTATVTYNETRTDGACANSYSLARTWTATDACGLTSVHTQTITVQDTTAPTFVETLPTNVTVECNAVPTAETLTATDNCGTATVTYNETRTDGACANSYSLARTWTATDACGLTSVHTQTITVQDTTAPTFVETLPTNVTVECNAVPTAETLTATDNCGTATVTYNETRTDGACANSYSLARTWTATDACGLTSVHTQTITVQDTTAPTFVETLPTNVTVECNAVPTAETLTATDNCGTATVTYNETRTDGACANSYSLARTWTATDACGLTTTHVQTITVQDTTAPTFVETLPTNVMVECNAVPTAETLTATDNCGTATVTYNETRTGGACSYSLARTWTVTDACGLTSVHTQTITVQDTTAPIIDAVADDYSATPINGTSGGTTAVVLANDTLNGVILTASQVSLTAVSVPTGLTLNADGTISVAPNTAAGTYAVTYSICEVLNPTNCDTATATVVVAASVIVVVQTPKIAIIKTGTINDLNSDGYQEIGETITYSFAISNTGNVALTNVMVTDLLPGIAMTGNPINLQVGETNTTEFKGVYTLTKEDMIRGYVSNQATVRGTTLSGAIVTDLSDDSSIMNDKPTVSTISGCTIEVFNAVSPNGDGDNDVFYIRGLECYPDNTVEIYNRWGVLVFERSGYNNEDKAFIGISESRVTVHKSEELPAGTYYYIFKYKDSKLNAHEKAGYLYISR